MRYPQTFKVPRIEVLDGRASGNDLSFVTGNVKSNVAETGLKRGKEKLHRREATGEYPVIEKKEWKSRSPGNRVSVSRAEPVTLG